MSDSDPDLTVLRANLLAAVVARPGSMVTEIGDAIEAVYGIELPNGTVYSQVSRLAAMGLVEKSDPRGAHGKSITATAAGRSLVEDRYEWVVERVDEVAEG